MGKYFDKFLDSANKVNAPRGSLEEKQSKLDAKRAEKIAAIVPGKVYTDRISDIPESYKQASYGVEDGDNINELRLAGVDAPETPHSYIDLENLKPDQVKKYEKQRNHYNRVLGTNNAKGDYSTVLAQGEKSKDRLRSALWKDQPNTSEYGAVQPKVKYSVDTYGKFNRPIVQAWNPVTGEKLNDVMNNPEDHTGYYDIWNQDHRMAQSREIVKAKKAEAQKVWGGEASGAEKFVKQSAAVANATAGALAVGTINAIDIALKGTTHAAYGRAGAEDAKTFEAMREKLVLREGIVSKIAELKENKADPKQIASFEKALETETVLSEKESELYHRADIENKAKAEAKYEEDKKKIPKESYPLIDMLLGRSTKDREDVVPSDSSVMVEEAYNWITGNKDTKEFKDVKAKRDKLRATKNDMLNKLKNPDAVKVLSSTLKTQPLVDSANAFMKDRMDAVDSRKLNEFTAKTGKVLKDGGTIIDAAKNFNSDSAIELFNNAVPYMVQLMAGKGAGQLGYASSKYKEYEEHYKKEYGRDMNETESSSAFIMAAASTFAAKGGFEVALSGKILPKALQGYIGKTGEVLKPLTAKAFKALPGASTKPAKVIGAISGTAAHKVFNYTSGIAQAGAAEYLSEGAETFFDQLGSGKKVDMDAVELGATVGAFGGSSMNAAIAPVTGTAEYLGERNTKKEEAKAKYVKDIKETAAKVDPNSDTYDYKEHLKVSTGGSSVKKSIKSGNVQEHLSSTSDIILKQNKELESKFVSGDITGEEYVAESEKLNDLHDKYVAGTSKAADTLQRDTTLSNIKKGKVAKVAKDIVSHGLNYLSPKELKKWTDSVPTDSPLKKVTESLQAYDKLKIETRKEYKEDPTVQKVINGSGHIGTVPTLNAVFTTAATDVKKADEMLTEAIEDFGEDLPDKGKALKELYTQALKAGSNMNLALKDPALKEKEKPAKVPTEDTTEVENSSIVDSILKGEVIAEEPVNTNDADIQAILKNVSTGEITPEQASIDLKSINKGSVIPEEKVTSFTKDELQSAGILDSNNTPPDVGDTKPVAEAKPVEEVKKLKGTPKKPYVDSDLSFDISKGEVIPEEEVTEYEGSVPEAEPTDNLDKALKGKVIEEEPVTEYRGKADKVALPDADAVVSTKTVETPNSPIKVEGKKSFDNPIKNTLKDKVGNASKTELKTKAKEAIKKLKNKGHKTLGDLRELVDYRSIEEVVADRDALIEAGDTTSETYQNYTDIIAIAADNLLSDLPSTNGSKTKKQNDEDVKDLADFNAKAPKKVKEMFDWAINNSKSKIQKLVLKAAKASYENMVRKGIVVTEDAEVMGARDFAKHIKDTNGKDASVPLGRAGTLTDTKTAYLRVSKGTALNGSEIFSHRLMAHELMHLVTSIALNSPENSDLVTEVNALISDIREFSKGTDYEKAVKYATKNPHELFSELMNPALEEMLKDMEVKSPTLYQRIASFVKKILGLLEEELGVEQSALAEVLGVYDHITEGAFKTELENNSKFSEIVDSDKETFKQIVADKLDPKSSNVDYEGASDWAVKNLKKASEMLVPKKSTAITARIPNLLKKISYDKGIADIVKMFKLTSAEALAFSKEAKSILAYSKAYKMTYNGANSSVLKASIVENDISLLLSKVYGDMDGNVIVASKHHAMSWLHKESLSTLYRSDDDLKKLLSLSDHDKLNEHAQKLRGKGFPLKEVAKRIGANIRRDVGIAMNDDMEEHVQNKLDMALGLNALMPLIGTNQVKINKASSREMQDASGKTLNDSDASTNFIRVTVNEDGTVPADLKKKIEDRNSDVIKSLEKKLYNTKEFFGFSNKPITAVTKFVSTLSDSVPKIIQKAQLSAQNVAYVPKENMFNFMSAMPENMLKRGLKYTPNEVIENEKHVTQREGLKGVNIQIEGNLEKIKIFMGMRKEGDYDTPFYLAYRPWKQLRLGDASKLISLQRSKIDRSMFGAKAWDTTVSVDNPNHMIAFASAIEEQLGESVEKAVDKYGDILNILDAGSIKENSKALSDFMLENTGIASIDAAYALASYRKAISNGKNTFDTNLATEIDGITNGIANAMYQMLPNLSQDTLDFLNKTGFISQDDVNTVEEYLEKYNAADNYKTLTKGTLKAIQDILDNPAAVIAEEMDVEAFNTFSKLLPVLVDKNGDVTSDGRTFAKNPLMVAAYGAGIPALIDAIADHTIELLYEGVPSKDNETYRAIWELLGDSKYKEFLGRIRKDGILEVRFSKWDEITIRKRFKKSYGLGVENGIKGLLGEFFENRNLVNGALRVAAEVFVTEWNNEVADILKNTKDKHYLTRNDKKNLLDKFKKEGRLPSFATAGTEEIADKLSVISEKKDKVPHNRGGKVSVGYKGFASKIPVNETDKAAPTMQSSITSTIDNFEYSGNISVKGFLTANIALDAIVNGEIMADEQILGIFDATYHGITQSDSIGSKSNAIEHDVHMRYSMVDAVKNTLDSAMERYNKLSDVDKQTLNSRLERNIVVDGVTENLGFTSFLGEAVTTPAELVPLFKEAHKSITENRETFQKEHLRTVSQFGHPTAFHRVNGDAPVVDTNTVQEDKVRAEVVEDTLFEDEAEVETKIEKKPNKLRALREKNNAGITKEEFLQRKSEELAVKGAKKGAKLKKELEYFKRLDEKSLNEIFKDEKYRTSLKEKKLKAKEEKRLKKREKFRAEMAQQKIDSDLRDIENKKQSEEFKKAWAKKKAEDDKNEIYYDPFGARIYTEEQQKVIDEKEALAKEKAAVEASGGIWFYIEPDELLSTYEEFDVNAISPEVDARLDKVTHKLLKPMLGNKEFIKGIKNISKRSQEILDLTEIYPEPDAVVNSYTGSMSNKENYTHNLTYAMWDSVFTHNVTVRNQIFKLRKAVLDQVGEANIINELNKNDPALTEIENLNNAKNMYNTLFSAKEGSLEHFSSAVLLDPSVEGLTKNVDVGVTKKSKKTIKDKVWDILVKVMDMVTGTSKITTRNNSSDKIVKDIAKKYGKILNKEKSALRIETIENGMDNINSKATSAFSKYIAKPWIAKTTEVIADQSKDRTNWGVIKRSPYALTSLFVNDESKRKMNEVAKDLGLSRSNAVRETFIEARGSTKDTRKWQRLLMLAKHGTDSAAASVHTSMSKAVTEAFGNTLNKKARNLLYRSALKTDLSSIVDFLSADDVIKLYESKRFREAKIKELENSLKSFAGDRYFFYVNQTNGLSNLMIHNRSPLEMQHANAYTIANMTMVVNKPKLSAANVKKAEALIDALTSIKAINLLDPKDLEDTGLVLRQDKTNTDGKGMGMIIGIHKANKEKFLTDVLSGNKRLTRKGYVKSNMSSRKAVRLGDNTEETKAYMRKNGFFLSPADSYKTADGIELSVYVSKVAGLQKYASGITSMYAQNKNTLDQGNMLKNIIVDGKFKESGLHTVEVFDALQVKMDPQMSKILPIDPEVTNYVPLLSAVDDSVTFALMQTNNVEKYLLKSNNYVDDVLGRMGADIVVRAESPKYNKQVVRDALDDYKKEFLTDRDAFVRIHRRSKDPRLKAIAKMLPDEMWNDVRDIWGNKDNFYIKEDMLNTIFGYRKWSAVDAVDSLINKTSKGKSNLDILHVPGKEEYTLKTIGDITADIWVNGFVAGAKKNIVMFMPSVLKNNVISNVIVSWFMGMPLNKIKDYSSEAVKEVVRYKDMLEEIARLTRGIEASTNKRDIAKYNKEIKFLEVELKSSYVHELMEAGIHQTIVEDLDETNGSVLQHVNDMLGENSKVKKFKDKGYKVPFGKEITKGYDTVVMSNGTVAGDLAVKATQYSDVIARVAAYRFLTQDKGMANLDALDQVMDDFVSYDLPSSRYLTWLSDSGLLLFTKFSIRIQKIIYKKLVANPVRVASATMAQNVFGDVSDITDTFILGQLNLDRFTSPSDIVDAAINPNLLNYLDLIIPDIGD